MVTTNPPKVVSSPVIPDFSKYLTASEITTAYAKAQTNNMGAKQFGALQTQYQIALANLQKKEGIAKADAYTRGVTLRDVEGSDIGTLNRVRAQVGLSPLKYEDVKHVKAGTIIDGRVILGNGASVPVPPPPTTGTLPASGTASSIFPSTTSDIILADTSSKASQAKASLYGVDNIPTDNSGFTISPLIIILGAIALLLLLA